jgi:hypothetical protein
MGSMQVRFLVMASALLLAACSSSTGSTPAGTSSSGAASGSGKCADGTTGDFCGHIKISGGYTLETDFHASSAFATSCSNWLKGKRDDSTLLGLPSLLDAQTRITTDDVVQHYKGPGTYGAADLIGALGGFQIVVDHDGFEIGPATAMPPSTASATVNPDGSGTITATNLVPVGDANKVQQPINVLMTWTCVMAP